MSWSWWFYVIKKESEVVKRWSNDLERNAVSIFKNLGVLSKSTHEGSVLFQIKHYSVQLAILLFASGKEASR